jgi:hypothetical protein
LQKSEKGDGIINKRNFSMNALDIVFINSSIGLAEK